MGLVTFTIMTDGSVIPDTVEVVSIQTWATVNLIPRARIVMLDGNGGFGLSDSATFHPGKEVVILAGHGRQERQIFTGVIVSQTLEIGERYGARLVVEMADAAKRMMLGRRNAVFENVTDSDLMTTLISASDLAADVEATAATHEHVVQYDATDWDMLLTRAQANGRHVIADAGTVTVAKPDTSGEAALVLSYGDNILDLSIDIDAATQMSEFAIKSFAWDPGAQELIEASPGPVSIATPGDLSPETLAEVFDVDSFVQQTGAPIKQSALTEWSTATLGASRLAKIHGTVRFPGSAMVKTGGMVQLDGIGERFSGKAFVGGVEHLIEAGRWTTTCRLGMSSRRLATETPTAPRAGLLPPIHGLHSGVVRDVGDDPTGGYRVLVDVPLLRAAPIWARLASFAASNDAGAVFYPEVGDEVVIGFMNDDPRFPVILGSLYSASRVPPFPPDDTKRAVVTKGGQSIVFDDGVGSVAITDQSENSITMSESGITLRSMGAIDISADGNVSITAGGDIELRADADITSEATNIDHQANAEFSASGSAAAVLESGGTCTVKGSLIQIN